MLRIIPILLGMAAMATAIVPPAQANPESEEWLSALESRSVSDDYQNFFGETEAVTPEPGAVRFTDIYQSEPDFQLNQNVEVVFGDTLETDTIFEIGQDPDTDDKFKVQYQLTD